MNDWNSNVDTGMRSHDDDVQGLTNSMQTSRSFVRRVKILMMTTRTSLTAIIRTGSGADSVLRPIKSTQVWAAA